MYRRTADGAHGGCDIGALWPLVPALAVIVLVIWSASGWVLDSLGGPDESLVLALRDARTPVLDVVARAVSLLGSGWFALGVVAVAAALAHLAGRWSEAIVLFLASGGGFLMSQAGKIVVGRARPGIEAVADAWGHAFPSGHAIQSVVLWGALAYLLSRRLSGRASRTTVCVLAATLALVVGASRVYLGVHWPSDVLTGWMAGAAWLAAVLASCRRAGLDGPADRGGRDGTVGAVPRRGTEST